MSNDYQIRILAIDDDASNLAMINEVLKDSYKIYTATSAKSALRFLEKHHPDLILLDVEMPEMTGPEMIKIIKEEDGIKDIPVIFLTGHLDDETESMAFNLGAVDYIKKPFNRIVMRARIKLHLELERHRQNLEYMVVEKTSQVSTLQDVTLDLLANITEFRDTETGEHIKRTTGYVGALVSGLSDFAPESYHVSEEFINDILKSSVLHDIGKVSIPDHILLKPGKLTAEEFEVMKTHTVNGSKLLQRAIRKYNGQSFLDMANEVAVSHHEKWDGSGYPNNLKETQIPLSGRIMAIADVYDALTSKRPYKDKIKSQKAFEIMAEGRGTHFDPILLDLFFSLKDKIKEIQLSEE